MSCNALAAEKHCPESKERGKDPARHVNGQVGYAHLSEHVDDGPELSTAHQQSRKERRCQVPTTYAVLAWCSCSNLCRRSLRRNKMTHHRARKGITLKHHPPPMKHRAKSPVGRAMRRRKRVQGQPPTQHPLPSSRGCHLLALPFIIPRNTRAALKLNIERSILKESRC